jgi:hypothetical protein
MDHIARAADALTTAYLEVIELPADTLGLIFAVFDQGDHPYDFVQPPVAIPRQAGLVRRARPARRFVDAVRPAGLRGRRARVSAAGTGPGGGVPAADRERRRAGSEGRPCAGIGRNDTSAV